VPPPTEVKTFTAFADGRIALKIVRTSAGECWGGAIAVRRSDAWRCHSGSRIYDPCFSRPKGSSGVVVCPTSYPWIRRAVELKLSSQLPFKFGNRRGSPTAGRPWAVQTTDGKNCIAYTGATKTIGGKVVSYGCSSGGGLLDGPQKKSKPWRIRYVRGSKTPAWVQIKTAWW